MAEFIAPTSVSRDLIKKEHPAYSELYRHLRFGRESYEGSGAYAPWMDDVTVADRQPDDQQQGTLSPNDSRRTYLFRHPREKKKFERRVMMAYLTNIIKRAVRMIMGFLTKKQPIYDKYPKSVKDWMSSVNEAGDTWEQFKRSDILTPLSYYGFLPVIFFHLKTDGAVTAYQQIADGGDLQADIINPENIVDWALGPGGEYLWLKVKTKVDLTKPQDKEQVLVDRYTWYAQDGWFAVNDVQGSASDLVVMEGDSGSWPTGVMPIVTWRIKGGPLTVDATAVQRELYNISSLIQEQERETTFAMLRAPGGMPEGNSRTITGASDNVFWFPEESRHPPEWMAPPPHVLAHLMAKRAVLIEEILESMGLDFDEGGGTTGVAFQFKMSKIVRMLQDLANGLSVSESRSLEVVALENGEILADDVRTVWPSEFDAKDMEKEMDALERVLDRVFSDAARAEAQYRMATTAMTNLDEELRTTIRAEIDQGIEEDKLDEDNNEQPPDEDNDNDPDVDDDDDLPADGSAR